MVKNLQLFNLANEYVSEGPIIVSVVCSKYPKSMVETSNFNLIVVNLFFIHENFIIIKNWGISVITNLANCGMQPKRAIFFFQMC